MDPRDLDLTIKFADDATQWAETSDLTQTRSMRQYQRTVRIDVTEKIETFLNAETHPEKSRSSKNLHKRILCHSERLKPGQEVDYELLRVLGEGGMGKVYEAKQLATGRLVALKILESKDHQIRYEFAREAIINANLEHPGIIRVYELAISEEFGLFYAMERIHGKPWSKAIKDQKMDEKLNIFMRLLDAVAYAHSCGIIHRDLKPSNIMLGEFGNTLLVDWGLALSREEIVACRKIPNLYGSLPYMAPEMLSTNTRDLGVHSDIYMLGAILYQIMTGNPPHTREGEVRERLQEIKENNIKPIEGFPLLGQIAHKALSTSPIERYVSVEDFQYSIQNYLQNRSVYTLVQNGKAHLKEGEKKQSLHSLNRALFAFQDALEILPNSETAQEACHEAEEVIAQTALKLGDIAYAGRIVASESFQNLALKNEIALAVTQDRRRIKRVRLFGWATTALGVILFGLLITGLLWMRHEKLKTTDALTLAEQETLRAEEALIQVREQRENIKQTLTQLQNQKGITADALLEAKNAESMATQAKESALYEFRRAQLSSLGQHIENGLPYATLRTQLAEIPEELRGEEWGILHGIGHPWLHERTLHSPMRTAFFSQDHSLLIIGLEDGSLELMDTLWGTPLHQYFVHNHPVQAVTLDIKNARIYSLDREGNFVATDTFSGNALPVPAGIHTETILEMSLASNSLNLWTASGRWLELTENNTLHDVNTDTEHHRFSQVKYSPFGDQMAALTAEHLFIFNSDGTHSQTTLNQQHPLSLTWLQDASEISILYPNGLVTHHQTTQGSLTGFTRLPEAAALSWIPLNLQNRVAVRTAAGKGIRFWDRHQNQFLSLSPMVTYGHHISKLFADPVSGFMVTGDNSNKIRIWHHLGFQPALSSQKTSGKILASALNPLLDQRVRGDSDGQLHLSPVFIPGNAQTIQAHKGKINDLVISQNGDYIVSGGVDNLVKVFEAKTGKLYRTFKGHISAVSCVDIQGDQIISGGIDGMVFIWSLKDGRSKQKYRAHTAFLRDVRLHPNGAWVSADEEGRVCIGNTQSDQFKILSELKIPVSEINWLNPQELAVGDDLGTVHIFDLTRQEKIATRQMNRHPITLLQNLSNGHWMSATSDGSPQIWNHLDEKPLWTLPVPGNDWTKWISIPEGYALLNTKGDVQLLPALPDSTDAQIGELLATRIGLRLGAVTFSPDDSEFAKEIAIDVQALDPKRQVMRLGTQHGQSSEAVSGKIHLNQDSILRVKTQSSDSASSTDWVQTRFYHRLQLHADTPVRNIAPGINMELSSQLWMLDVNPLNFEAETTLVTTDIGKLPGSWQSRNQVRGRYTGYIYIPKSGRVNLSLSPTSQGIVDINGKRVLSNYSGSEHTLLKSRLALKAGYHPFTATWMRANVTDTLDLFIQFAGENPKPITPYLFH